MINIWPVDRISTFFSSSSIVPAIHLTNKEEKKEDNTGGDQKKEGNQEKAEEKPLDPLMNSMNDEVTLEHLKFVSYKRVFVEIREAGEVDR